MTVVSGTMLVLGFGFVFAGVIGILRLPDFYCRLHAMGKCDTLGVALMLGGLAVHEGVSLTSFKMLLVLLFVSLANPCLLYTSPSPRDLSTSRMPSSA